MAVTSCLTPEHNVTSCVVRGLIERSMRGPVELPRFSREVALGLMSFRVDIALIERYLKELYQAMKAAYPVVYRIDLELTTPLVIHTRNPYMPLEIGIAWHPYFNTPYIPATSIKGALRSGAGRPLCGKSPAELFGEAEDAGEVALTDAFPTTPDVLSADVITPHYKEPDFRETSTSPTPLVFPVARPGASFAFLIGLNLPCDFAEVYRYISATLREGLGAKTRVGYGIVKLK